MQDVLERSDLRVPIRTWLPLADIEPAAMQQLEAAARHPEAISAIAVMPDCHVGFGVTIGCVFPTLDAVVPNAVGVDIGCGICAIDTGITLDRGWTVISGGTGLARLTAMCRPDSRSTNSRRTSVPSPGPFGQRPCSR